MKLSNLQSTVDYLIWILDVKSNSECELVGEVFQIIFLVNDIMMCTLHAVYSRNMLKIGPSSNIQRNNFPSLRNNRSLYISRLCFECYTGLIMQSLCPRINLSLT